MTDDVLEVASRPPTTPAQGRRRRWALILLCAAFFLVVSDSTIVYTALPAVREGLAVPDGQLQWVVVAYMLTSGVLLLPGGRTADLFGRRRMFLVGVLLFSAMSLLSGLAWSPAVLIAARMAQGVGVAIMVPAALSIVVVAFPDGADRNRALGVWGALAGIGATGGLLLGGPITELLGWRWVFLVNVPVGATIAVLSPLVLPSDADQPRGPLGRLTGPGQPLVPLRLFRSRTLVGGNLVILAAGVSVDGLLFTVTLLTQQVLGYSATSFGLALTVMTATSFVGVAVGQRLVSRFGVRPVAASGLVLIAVGAASLSLVAPGDPFIGPLGVGLALFGPGMGAAFVAGQVAALSGVPSQDAGIASGVEETTFAVGGAIGVVAASRLALSGPDLLSGSQAAFVGVAAVAVLGLVATVGLVGGDVGREVIRPGSGRR